MTQAFNLSQLANKVNTSGQLDASTGLYNQTPVPNGGTGVSSITAGALLIGAGTSAMVEVAGTGANQVLASSPTGWASSPASSVGGGNYVMQTYTSSTTWTKPGSLKAIKVTVVGGGGNGGASSGSTTPATNNYAAGGGGGGGGGAIIYLPAPSIPGPQTVTVGPAIASSFGGIISATAGAAGGSVPGNTNGIGAGGAGGSGSGGTINTKGTAGGAGVASPGQPAVSGAGGYSMFLLGAPSATAIAGGPGGTNSTPGIAGTVYGTGGSGAAKSSALIPALSGGAGAPGVVIVEEFY